MSDSREVILSEKAQEFIKKFRGTEGLELNMKINVRYDGPSTILHTYDTEGNHDLIHILERDFVQSMTEVRAVVKEFLGYVPKFYEVKNPIQNFQDTQPYKSASVYKLPENSKELLKYAYPSSITAEYLFGFVIAGKPDDKINITP